MDYIYQTFKPWTYVRTKRADFLKISRQAAARRKQ